MELRQLRAFVAVAEMGGVSKAARMLFISQPTLSYQISSLEDEIGKKLFLRENSKITMTPLAQEMLEPIKKVLGDVDNIKFRLMRGEEGVEDNTLRVGFSRMPLHDNFLTASSIVEKFTQESGVNVLYNRLSEESCMSGVRDGDLDLAFVNMREYDKLPMPFIFNTVSEDRFVLLVAAKHGKVTFERAMKDFKLIQVSQMENREQDYEYAFSGLDVVPETVSAINLEEAFSMVEAGDTVMMWPKSDYEKYLSLNLNAIDIPGDRGKLLFGVIWNCGSQKTALKKFTETLEK